MDTSQQYIKMCEKAFTDLPKEPEAWDYWYVYDIRNDEKSVKVLSDYSTDSGFYGPGFEGSDLGGWDLLFPLPRQDQLQKMVHSTDWISVLERFCIFAFHGPQNYTLSKPIYYGVGIPHNLSSMEQLWLAFIMHEKYDKVWDSQKEEWVKEEYNQPTPRP